MNLRIREFGPDDPTFVEALAWTGRNILALPAPFVVLFGDLSDNFEIIEKGAGMLALAGICEVIRRAERGARQQPTP